MTSIDGGQLQQLVIKPENEEEEEIKRLFLGLMDGYNDSVISPLSYFSQSKSNGEKVGAGSLQAEKKRRCRLTEYYSVLDSIVPNNSNSFKRTKENIVDDTLNYVKLLEDEVEMLEVLKKSRLEEPVMMTTRVLSKCTSREPVKVAITDCAATFFAIQRPFRRGLVQDIFKVLEKHVVEVLETRFWVDEERVLTFTATVMVGSVGAGAIDKIKDEVLDL